MVPFSTPRRQYTSTGALWELYLTVLQTFITNWLNPHTVWYVLGVFAHPIGLREVLVSIYSPGSLDI